MKAIFRDKLGCFTVSEVQFIKYLLGVWYVTFLDETEEEYHDTELLEVSL